MIQKQISEMVELRSDPIPFQNFRQSINFIISTVFNRTGFMTFFELYRINSVWFGYKFRNDSEIFGLVWNEFVKTIDISKIKA